MKKSDKKSKTEKAKTATPALYDCCWYEPSCYDLCCGGVCCCQALQMVLRDQQSSRGNGIYFFGLERGRSATFFKENVTEEERDDFTNQEDPLCHRSQ